MKGRKGANIDRRLLLEGMRWGEIREQGSEGGLTSRSDLLPRKWEITHDAFLRWPRGGGWE